MSFLVTIGLWLVKFAGSDLVKSILTRVVSDLVTEGKAELPYVQAAIEDAMRHDDWTAGQKLTYVQDAVKARFPYISSSLLNRLIENVYGALGLKAQTN